MGIDYDGVGGVGVELTEDMMKKFIEANVFTEDEWEDDPYECIEGIPLPHDVAGSFYSGDLTYYLFVEGSTLLEVWNNKDKFIGKLAEYGIEVKVEDLKIIEDYCIS